MADTQVEKLLPCPFCGIAVALFDGDTVRHPNSGCVLAGDHLDLAKWNTRPTMTAQSPNAGLVERLFAATAHGDDEHRAWLHEAYTAFFAGEPVPEPRGQGRKEARIAELEAHLSALAPPQADYAMVEALKDAKFAVDALEAQLIGFARPAINVEFIRAKIDAALAAHPSLRETKDA